MKFWHPIPHLTVRGAFWVLDNQPTFRIVCSVLWLRFMMFFQKKQFLIGKKMPPSETMDLLNNYDVHLTTPAKQFLKSGTATWMIRSMTIMAYAWNFRVSCGCKSRITCSWVFVVYFLCKAAALCVVLTASQLPCVWITIMWSRRHSATHHHEDSSKVPSFSGIITWNCHWMSSHWAGTICRLFA